MPLFTTTIEDFSPAISYSSDWAQGSSQSDVLTSSYSASSFFASNVTGGTASFTFNGTGVQLFGSKRQNHGPYQVTLDGQTFPVSSGQSNDPIFQTLLFSNTGLPQGEHTVMLQNQGTSAQFVDLDFITWYGNIGQSNEQLSVDTVEDNHASFVYSPDGAWTDNPSNLGFFHGSTGHSTTTPGASFTYTFQGDGVSLFGPVGPGYSSFSVQLNGVSQEFTAQKSRNASQVMLYHVDSLGPGQHTLEVLVQPSATGQALAIDYAEVFSTPSTLGSSSKSGGLSGGAVAGLVIGLLIACGILVVGLWFYLRRRRNRVLHCSDGPGALAVEFGKPSNPFNDMTGPVMYECNSEHTAPSRLIDPTPSFVDSSCSAPSIRVERSDSGSHSYASSTHSSLNRRDTNSTSPRRNLSVASGSTINSGRLLYTKGAAPTLPRSAGESLADVSVEQLAATRMVVEGRPQDFGAVLESDENVASGSTSESYTEHHPPPDYHQATETYH